MPGDVLMALAQFAGQTVETAAVTDVREADRGKFARLLGRGDVRRTQVAVEWLEQTRQQLAARPGRSWSRPGRRRQRGERADSRTCWTRTRTRKRNPACWWRKSQPSCPLQRRPQPIIRSRLGT
jgi:hypothetical protein